MNKCDEWFFYSFKLFFHMICPVILFFSTKIIAKIILVLVLLVFVDRKESRAPIVL